MRTSTVRGIAGLALAAGVLVAGSARGAPESPPAQPWPTSPRPAEDAAQPEPGPALPGLDDLLGLPGDGVDGAEPARDPSRDALDRQLDLEAPGDPFEQAVELMGRSAVRLVDAGDAGLGTQRIQEEVIRKLDKMIDEAQKSQQQQSSKSKSRSQSQQQQQQQRQETQAETKSGDNTGQTQVPGRQDGPRRDGAPPSTAAWGNLPEHVREALMQGFSDRFSSLYQSMTEAYYRKLAEEPRK